MVEEQENELNQIEQSVATNLNTPLQGSEEAEMSTEEVENIVVQEIETAASEPQTKTKMESLPSYDEVHLLSLKNTSERIRWLASLKIKNGDIAKILQKHFGAGRPHPFRYQHVRNVLATPLKAS